MSLQGTKFNGMFENSEVKEIDYYTDRDLDYDYPYDRGIDYDE